VNYYKLINTNAQNEKGKIHCALLNVTTLAALPQNLSDWTCGSLHRDTFELSYSI